MDQRFIAKKLRDCAKGLLDIARELQSSEREDPPRTFEIDDVPQLARCRFVRNKDAG